MRIAELLGVAGTDVPIREIEKLTPPYQVKHTILGLCWAGFWLSLPWPVYWVTLDIFKGEPSSRQCRKYHSERVLSCDLFIQKSLSDILCFACGSNHYIIDVLFHILKFCLQLGVNGYAYAVNNNGYILFHPDLRPMVSI